MHRSVRARVFSSIGVVGLLALSACQDKRIKAVDTGISRDSLIKVIGQDGPAADSTPNVYRSERYLIDAKNYEIFYFSKTGTRLIQDAKDTLPWKQLVPIAMINNVVVGKEWNYIDSLYKAHNIPLHPR